MNGLLLQRANCWDKRGLLNLSLWQMHTKAAVSMNSPNSIDVLNRLVVIHHRSLASYLAYASPAWHGNDGDAKAELDRIVADQQELVDRMGKLVVQHNGIVNYGSYPMEFTGYHDLSFGFLLKKLVTEQQIAIESIEGCVSRLDADPAVRSIAQEALGLAKGHLESLGELQKSG